MRPALHARLRVRLYDMWRRVLPRLWLGLQNWLLDWRSHAWTVLLVVVMAWGINAWQTRHVPTGIAPEFTALLAGSDNALTLTQWRAQHPGRAVALYFWADWCPICRMEENSISAVQRDWPVLTIAMRSGDAAKVTHVLSQRQLPWRAAIDPDGSLAARYGLQAVPAFIVLDAQGQIRHAAVGYTTEWGMRLRLWWAEKGL